MIHHCMRHFCHFFRHSLTFSIFTVSAVLVCGSACSRYGYNKAEGMIWNTVWHATFNGPASLADSIPEILRQVGHSVSVFDDSSVCSLVNSSDSAMVDSHFRQIYEMTEKIHALTDGAFDPTLSPVIDAWGFGRSHKATADTARIDSIMSFVGLDKTTLRKNNMLVKKHKLVRFNFSAIAKGYGADAVGCMFRRNGVSDYLIEIGGEIASGGNNPEGGKWRISVDSPDRDALPASSSRCMIEVTDCGVATSGDYRNYHSDNSNGIYGHTIDASTGRPAGTDVISATVVARSAMEADAIATACMAMGSERIKKLSDRHPEIKVMIILQDSSVWMSKSFETVLNTLPV